MDKLFLTILNMSLTGTFVIAVICLARLLLKRAPKIISYCMWAIAGFRLMCPISIESIFSLIPFSAQTIPIDIATQTVPHVDSGIAFVNDAVNSALSNSTLSNTVSTNPLQVWTAVGTWVWISVVAVMLIYGVVSFIILKQKMQIAVHIKGNLYETERIKSPFVLGLFKPSIYLPVDLSEQEKSYIIQHEQTHIRRHDHIIKFVTYFVLCLHWFNPLVWVAFRLMSVDMEMSCDERVLKEANEDIKKAYSLSLLSLATERRFVSASPLSFGEENTKERVKNVLSFKKHSRVIIIAAVALVAVLSIGLVSSRASEQSPSEESWNMEEQGGVLIEDNVAIYVNGRKEVYMAIALYEAWVAAGETDADVYDYAECVIYTPIGKGRDERMYMRIDDYKAWAAAGENDADVYDYAVPYVEE